MRNFSEFIRTLHCRNLLRVQTSWRAKVGECAEGSFDATNSPQQMALVWAHRTSDTGSDRSDGSPCFLGSTVPCEFQHVRQPTPTRRQQTSRPSLTLSRQRVHAILKNDNTVSTVQCVGPTLKHAAALQRSTQIAVEVRQRHVRGRKAAASTDVTCEHAFWHAVHPCLRGVPKHNSPQHTLQKCWSCCCSWVHHMQTCANVECTQPLWTRYKVPVCSS